MKTQGGTPEDGKDAGAARKCRGWFRRQPLCEETFRAFPGRPCVFAVFRLCASTREGPVQWIGFDRTERNRRE
ncbi:hypothetical protein EAI89_18715 [Eubacterium sp. am_0171]|nr:hypothetical protein EAI89_18715 [Eubacterium sp. am_0171]